MTTNDIDARLNGLDLFGEPIHRQAAGPVAEKFGFPPFSVLDARQGEWQDRKRAWVSLGIKSENGRSRGLSGLVTACHVQRTGESSSGLEQDKENEQQTKDGTSIFDPTLCECIYRWFAGKGQQIVDPFAGGSVRGIVAGMLNRKYWGCDLRQEQVDANREQADKIDPDTNPEWVCGDSMIELDNAPLADLIFSCPPYGDLEVYSDDPADLSNMEWHTFVANYKRIILRSCKRLKNDRFACFVVGDFRDKKGFYRDFVSTTISAFRECGLELYNEGILITQIGSAGMRITRQFNAGRKFAKTHQNVLVFCKGDWRRAVDAIKKADGE